MTLLHVYYLETYKIIINYITLSLNITLFLMYISCYSVWCVCICVCVSVCALESDTVSITVVIPRLPRKNRGNGNKTGGNTAVAVIFLGITAVAVKILTTAVTAVLPR